MRRLHFIILSFASLSVGCDGILMVDGRVVDGAGMPIPGAKIDARGMGPGAVVTDEQGCFHYMTRVGWPRQDVPIFAEADGRQTHLGDIEAPAVEHVLVRLPREGSHASMEKVVADPSCPRSHAGAVQHGVAPDDRSPAAPARR